MWVQRAVMFIKDGGLMAEAVAHVKAMPATEGVTLRLLRPVTGESAAGQLIIERSFDDLDAVMASYSYPKPPDERMRRWVEINQNRGILELYEVRHAIPAQGETGLWVDRRIRYVKDRRRGEMLALLRGVPALGVAGESLRVVTPRTGEADGDVLIVEQTASSLAELDKAIGAFGSSPEGKAFALQVFGLEQHTATRELLRVVP